jgi:NAD(P)H-hydrate epimerase
MKGKIRPLSRAEVRDLDLRAARDLALPTLVLMENAGRGAAAWLQELIDASSSSRLHNPKVLVLCGPGNNGGDGGVVARHLDSWGIEVTTCWFAERIEIRADAAIQWEILTRSGVKQITWGDDHANGLRQVELNSLLAEADWVVDGLLGTGLTRPVQGKMRSAIEAMNCSGKPIFSLDLPSGLEADTGIPLGVAVRARATATFVAPKLGFSAARASDYTGDVAVIEIGLPRCVLKSYEQS